MFDTVRLIGITSHFNVKSNYSVPFRFQKLLVTENWSDCEICSVLIGSPVSTLSGEWPGDEEVDGRAFSNHHGHAAGLLLIGQTAGMS